MSRQVKSKNILQVSRTRRRNIDEFNPVEGNSRFPQQGSLRR
jgi:hypothetical protein